MFYGDQRQDTRAFFFTVWQKMQNKAPLLPMEGQIADVISLHPEYAEVVSDPQKNLEQDYSVEKGQSNPFLHMGMHLAVREQVGTNRPFGIQLMYQQYCNAFGDSHAAEHAMFETLGEILWEAQRAGTAPNELRYLELLNERLPRS